MFKNPQNSSSSAMKQYIKDVRTVLPCYGKQERAFIKYLKQQLTDHIEENPSITYDDLIQKFGHPANLIADYYQSSDEDLLVHRLKIRKYFYSVIIACVLAVLFVSGLRYAMLEKVIYDTKHTKIQKLPTKYRSEPDSSTSTEKK